MAEHFGIPNPAELLRQVTAERKDVLVEDSFFERFMGFFHAIRWTEPWLVGILSFHVILWLLVIAVRRNNTAQMVVLTATCALVYSSQYANSYAAVHWRALGFTQNYFDEQGVFVSFVFSAPLLVLAFCQMLYSLRAAIELLVKQKSQELRRGIIARKAREGAQAALAAAGAEGAVDAAGPGGVAEPTPTESRKDR